MNNAFRFILLFFFSSFSFAACSITDQAVNFGKVNYSDPVGSVSIPIVVTVNCPLGVSYTLKPNSASLGYFNITMYREGNAKGYLYLYILNGSVIMKPAIAGSLINGVGTGQNQTYSLNAVLSGSASTGSILAFNKTGLFQSALQLFQLVSGGTIYSSARIVEGEVVGYCEISGQGAISYGTLPSPAVQTDYPSATSMLVRCDSTLAYTLVPDNSASRWTHSGGMGLDIAATPNPSNPAVFKVYVALAGNNAVQWGVNSYNKAGIGTGIYQTYDISGVLTLPPNWYGKLNSTIYLTVIF